MKLFRLYRQVSKIAILLLLSLVVVIPVSSAEFLVSPLSDCISIYESLEVCTSVFNFEDESMSIEVQQDGVTVENVKLNNERRCFNADFDTNMLTQVDFSICMRSNQNRTSDFGELVVALVEEMKFGANIETRTIIISS